MPKEAEFIIDGESHRIDVANSPLFRRGGAETLSRPDTDPTCGQEWYRRGFGVFKFLNEKEFCALHDGISESIRGLVAGLGVNTSGFSLSKYHHYAGDDALHRQVVGMSRSLAPSDFRFPISEVAKKLERLLGFGLSDIYPSSGERSNIIVRINRPGSTDFNPPHKDIYEDWDEQSILPPLVNFWIPVCGVSDRSSLPVVPGSHLLPENKIRRTIEGGMISGKQYRVRSVISWDNSNEMVRPLVHDGEVLIFSSHLIHGCAVNAQDDETRVALEFRLFKSGAGTR